MVPDLTDCEVVSLTSNNFSSHVLLCLPYTSYPTSYLIIALAYHFTYPFKIIFLFNSQLKPYVARTVRPPPRSGPTKSPTFIVADL
jgi:hypothetical protein